MLPCPVLMMTSVSGENGAEMGDDVPARNSGHAQIDDGDVEGVFFNGGDRGLTVIANCDFVPHPRQLDPHDIANRRFVVDEQDSQFIECRLAQPQPPCQPPRIGARRRLVSELF